MQAKIIDGRVVAKKLRLDYRTRVQKIQTEFRMVPGLAVIVVGTDAASRVYVRNKIAACSEVGVRSFGYDFSVTVDPDLVLEKIRELNVDPTIHGILVQLPLPPQFDVTKILHAISQEKDVDGFHLYNVGGLVVGTTIFPPCTPFGVVKLLEHESIEVEGKNVVVVGASNIVGKPMAL